MNYYESMFKAIKLYAGQYKDLKPILLSLLYKLLLINAKPIDLCTHEKTNSRKLSADARRDTTASSMWEFLDYQVTPVENAQT